MTTKLYIQLLNPDLKHLTLANPELQEITLTAPVADVTRARMSIDTTEAWSLKTDYIPAKGEIVVYTDRHVIDGTDYPGVKIGDGKAYVVDLPFIGDDTANQIIEDLNGHIQNVIRHITQEERDYWNNKLDCELNGEVLTLSPIPME